MSFRQISGWIIYVLNNMVESHNIEILRRKFGFMEAADENWNGVELLYPLRSIFGELCSINLTPALSGKSQECSVTTTHIQETALLLVLEQLVQAILPQPFSWHPLE